MTASVSGLEDEIAHLCDLDLHGLRARWHSMFRRKAPDHLPRHLLYRMIAYRLQAERLGDLDRDTQRFLDPVAAGTRNGDELPEGDDHRRHGLQPGTILVREWDGKPQRVMVLDEGYGPPVSDGGWFESARHRRPLHHRRTEIGAVRRSSLGSICWSRTPVDPSESRTTADQVSHQRRKASASPRCRPPPRRD
jgi:hypothetical protein